MFIEKGLFMGASGGADRNLRRGKNRFKGRESGEGKSLEGCETLKREREKVNKRNRKSQSSRG